MVTRKALVALIAAALVPSCFAAQPLAVTFHSYSSSQDFTAAGSIFEGTKLTPQGDAITYGSTAGTYVYADPFGYGTHPYEYARWTSPWFATGINFSELVPWWNADTPAGTWIQVEMEATADQIHTTKWYVMGRWAFGDDDFHRTSVGGQGDDDGDVSTDTFLAKGHPFTGYRLRVTLFKTPGATSVPTLSAVGAVASDTANAKPEIPSPLGGAEGTLLNVPQYSQGVHAGQYPQLDGGGEAWCSPTSTSMIVAFWKQGPSPQDYAYVQKDYPQGVDPWVDYEARHTFDYLYQGAGNWPFNTAYAAHFGLAAEVTQLRSLAEAERFIKAGIPLVASVAFSSNQLTGSPVSSTTGHLLTIVGFTSNGDVVSNDPAFSSDSTVQHTYDRAQFERAWLKGSGGIVYIVHPQSVALPPPAVPSQPNW
jgi:hypothetical protein